MFALRILILGVGVVGVFAAELITTKPRSRQNQKMDDNLAVRMAAETMLDLSAACTKAIRVCYFCRSLEGG